MKIKHPVLTGIVIGVLFFAGALIVSSYSGSSAPSWASSAVDQACTRGLIDCSLSNPQFSSTLNRATGYQMLTAGFGVRNLNARSPLRDVAGQWYEAAAHTAYTLGWTVGRNGLFLGNENFTRAQMAVATAAVLGLNPGNSSALRIYTDSSAVPSWATGSMSAMVQARLMGQGGNLSLRPNDPINKLEAIIVLNSAVTYAQTRSIDVVAVAAQRLNVTVAVLRNALNSGLNIVNGTASVPSAFPDFIYAMRSSWTVPELDDFQLDSINDIGMQYVQGIPSFFWGVAESGPNGDFMKWGEFDAEMDKLAARGLKVIPFIQTPKLAGLHWNSSILRTDPRYREEYGEYAYEVVNRYKTHPAWSGMIAVWGSSSDIWRDDSGQEISLNQPEVVIPLLNAVYDGVKRADTGTIVIGFNMGSDVAAEDFEQWHRRAFALSPRFDWFGVQTHANPVGVSNTESPYRGVTGLANIRRFLDQNGYANKPMFLNEGGYPIFNSAFNEQSQAEQAVETYITARTLNVNLKGWVYFILFGVRHADGSSNCGATNDGDNWGIMSCITVPNPPSMPQSRPAYRALKTLFTQIDFDAYDYESTLSGTANSPAPYVYKFKKRANQSSKLWIIFSPRLSGEQPIEQNVNINISPAPSAAKFDIFGNQTTVTANPGGNISVRSTGSPIYIKTTPP